MLRIISGKYRSIKLNQPPLEITRCTTDKVREAIFNMIQNEIENSIVLDGFSGSGAIAIEFASRHATKIFAIEKNHIAYSIIKENIEKLSINNIELIKGDLILFLNKKANIEFDFIFLDPPYKNIEILSESLKIIKEKSFLKKYGKIIVETDIDTHINLPKGLIISNEKFYGKTKITIITNFE